MKKNSKLKTAIFDSDLTLRELSEKSGVPMSYISMACQGRMNLTGDEEAAISTALALPVGQLFCAGQF